VSVEALRSYAPTRDLFRADCSFGDVGSLGSGERANRDGRGNERHAGDLSQSRRCRCRILGEQGKRIRRFAYTNYPYTYGNLTGGSVHDDGEIYAATMWKLLELWEGSGRTQERLLDYIVDA
jgi:hypothetical protein